MQFDQATLTWLLGLVVTLGGLAINWQNSRGSKSKQDRDFLSTDYARIAKERDDERERIKKIEEEHAQCKEACEKEKEELKKQIADRDEVIAKLTVERMNHWKGR